MKWYRIPRQTLGGLCNGDSGAGKTWAAVPVEEGVIGATSRVTEHLRQKATQRRTRGKQENKRDREADKDKAQRDVALLAALRCRADQPQRSRRCRVISGRILVPEASAPSVVPSWRDRTAEARGRLLFAAAWTRGAVGLAAGGKVCRGVVPPFKGLTPRP